MIIRPSDIHSDFGRAKLGVSLAAKELEIECNLQLMTQWLIKIDPQDFQAFIELAKELVNEKQIL